jgi:hypothetical protein
VIKVFGKIFFAFHRSENKGVGGILFLIFSLMGKSCLLGHTNWVRPDPDLCPHCNMELETMEHALLTCPARHCARDQFPPDLTLAEAWSSPNLLKIIGNYITCTRTGYPPSPPSSPAPSSPVSQTSSTL